MSRLLVHSGRIGALAAVAAIALAGCGSSGDDTTGSNAGKSPERSFQDSGYTFVHTHLWNVAKDKCRSPGGDKVDWATGQRGYCWGEYRDGSAPFSRRTGGVNLWQKNGNEGYKITQAVSLGDANDPKPGRSISCFIVSRASDACYTNYQTQKDQAVGQPGGPLSLKAEFPPAGLTWDILLRGFCKNGDDQCTP